MQPKRKKSREEERGLFSEGLRKSRGQQMEEGSEKTKQGPAQARPMNRRKRRERRS